MKKLNLLTRGEMKNVLGGVGSGGGGGTLPCVNYVVCIPDEGSMEPEIHYPNVCCNTWEDGLSFCRGLGHQGAVGCVDGGVS